MARRTKRMGKKKVLVVLDNMLLEEIDLLLKDFAPEEKMNRSQLMEDILYYVLGEEDIIEDIFPEEDLIDKLKAFKEKILNKFKAKRK